MITLTRNILGAVFIFALGFVLYWNLSTDSIRYSDATISKTLDTRAQFADKTEVLNNVFEAFSDLNSLLKTPILSGEIKLSHDGQLEVSQKFFTGEVFLTGFVEKTRTFDKIRYMFDGEVSINTKSRMFVEVKNFDGVVEMRRLPGMIVLTSKFTSPYVEMVRNDPRTWVIEMAIEKAQATLLQHFAKS